MYTTWHSRGNLTQGISWKGVRKAEAKCEATQSSVTAESYCTRRAGLPKPGTCIAQGSRNVAEALLLGLDKFLSTKAAWEVVVRGWR